MVTKVVVISESYTPNQMSPACSNFYASTPATSYHYWCDKHSFTDVSSFVYFLVKSNGTDPV